jgi:pimeloyl-ACP methyl ester carboxylesterase
MHNARTIAVCLLAAFCITASLSSCVSNIPISTDYNTESEKHEVVVGLRFVTNRRLRTTGSDGDYYGDDLGELSAGECKVGFEENDRRGDVLRVDPAPIESILPTNRARPFVIYIHGYGESFARSCRRAALLQHRLHLQDRLLLFSWPSSTYLTYAQDADDLESSLGHLNELLSAVADSVGQERMILLAHSMGSRGVIDALNLRDDGTARFASIVFIAPDIRRDVFLENVHILQNKASEITVYTSDNDRVLWLSATVNTSGRLGLAKEFSVDIEHLNIVDITPTGTNDISGHMYHMFNPAVTEDLRHLFGSALAVERREYQRVASEEPGFWKLEALETDAD